MEDVLTTSVPLKRRVIHNGATFTALTMREALVEDRLAIDQPGMNQAELELALIAHLASVPVELIRKLRLVDYQAVQKVLMDFPYPPETSSVEQSGASLSPSGDSH